MIFILYGLILIGALVFNKCRKNSHEAGREEREAFEKQSYLRHIVLTAVLFVFLLCASLVSPYKYQWEPSLLQPDYEIADILFLVWGTALFASLLFIIFSKPVKRKRLFYTANLLFAAYSLFRLASLFYIYGEVLFK